MNDTQDVVAQPLGVSLLKTIRGRGFYPQIFVTDNNLCCVGHLDAEMLKQDLAASQKCEARAKVCCTMYTWAMNALPFDATLTVHF